MITTRESPGSNTDLDTAQLDQFHQIGYLVLPGFLPADLVSALRPEVDRWVDDGLRARSIQSCLEPERYGLPPLMELEMPAHGRLITEPRLMALISQLTGPAFAYHHLHSDRQAPDLPGKAWHHDYESGPSVNPSHLMVHALHYLDGLDEQTSSLVVLPGSHRENAAKSARSHLGTDELAGEVVIDRLPPGSTVVLHSALFHARRRRPSTQGKPRYFLDVSYCQAGSRWPPVKPYWRHMLSRARELGLDGGRRPDLFADRHFTEYIDPRR